MRGAARLPTIVDKQSPIPPDPPEVIRREVTAHDRRDSPFLVALSGINPLRVRNNKYWSGSSAYDWLKS